MKDVSARTYCTNYSTTDSEKLVITTKASEQMSTSTGALLTNDLSKMKTKPTNGISNN